MLLPDAEGVQCVCSALDNQHWPWRGSLHPVRLCCWPGSVRSDLILCCVEEGLLSLPATPIDKMCNLQALYDCVEEMLLSLPAIPVDKMCNLHAGNRLTQARCPRNELSLAVCVSRTQ